LEKINGIILAGGKSSRMGADKGLVEVAGEKMITLVSRALQPVVSEILIITTNPAYHFLNYPLYPDLLPDLGPAGGIYTGLHYSSSERNIVLSCDMPYLSSDFLRHLLSLAGKEDITVPVYRSRIHPLCGIYSKRILPEWKKSIDNGTLKMTELLGLFTVNFVNMDLQETFNSEKLFRNINTPGDLEGN
jgi:molybdopterin-guanine dinucleotide biosynthesis protein A